MLIFYLLLFVSYGNVFALDLPSHIQIELDRIMCENTCAEENIIIANTECICNEEVSKGYQFDWNQYENQTLAVPTLFCRDENLLTFKIEKRNVTFLLELRTPESDWSFENSFTDEIITVQNLKSNAAYKIRLWGVSISEKTIYGSSESEWHNTLKLDYQPLLVPDLYLKKLYLEEEKYVAKIAWNPSSDLSCFYDFIWYAVDGNSDGIQQRELRKISGDFEIKIEDLSFGSNYSIAIMAKSGDWRRESEKTWLSFETHNCLDMYQTLEKCVPDPPQELEVEETFSDDSLNKPLYDIHIMWLEPKLLPNYYTIRLMTFEESSNNSKHFLNISGDSTNTLFNNVYIGVHYQVSVTAWSHAGHSNPEVIYRQVTRHSVIPKSWSTSNVLALVFAMVFVVVVLGGIVIFYSYYIKYKKDISRKRSHYFEGLELTTDYLETITENHVHGSFVDEFEIDEGLLHLESFLGQGAFGIVRKAWLTGDTNTTEVAVKMLTDDAKIEEIRQFHKEIEIMKSVGFHPHIVSMIGCCTKKLTRGPLLVVEYCSRGNLLDYLHTAWESITDQNLDIQYADVNFLEDDDAKQFSNKLYHLEASNENQLNTNDLLSIARQVALGMEYLARSHVIHRDLAARNILVTEDKTVKVSDFGLSRDVYLDNVYCKIGGGKLPVRWMALESLTHQRYTTQSDVWSYGILLWEIITLGASPYPGVATQDLLALLGSGYRMNCPSNCTEELFNIMSICWKTLPKDRPTFTEISKSLETMLENSSLYLHLDVAALKEKSSDSLPKLKTKTDVSLERYVKNQ